MEVEKFEKMLTDKKYDEIEQILISENKTNYRAKNTFLLAVCYSEQKDKENKAISLFKEIIANSEKEPYAYYYVASKTSKKMEAKKIVSEGIKNNPKSLLLHGQLLKLTDDEEKEIVFEDLSKKGFINNSILLDMISFYFEKEKYCELIKLLQRIDTSKDDISTNEDMEFLKIVANYMYNQELDKSKLDSIIVSDIYGNYGLVLRLIEIASNINSDINIANKLIEELSYKEGFEPPLTIASHGNYYFFDLSTVESKLISQIKQGISNLNYINKLDLIIDIPKFNECDLPKPEIKKIQKRLERQIKISSDKEIFKALLNLYEKEEGHIKYFDYYLTTIERHMHLTVSLDDFTIEEIEYVLNKFLKTDIYSYQESGYNSLIQQLIYRLFKFNKFDEIIAVIDHIGGTKHFEYLPVGFEIAYAYGERDRIKESKQLYEEFLVKHPNSPATINNLGFIYEKEGNIDKALSYYRKAKELESNEIYINNISRCEDIEKTNKEEALESKGLKNIDTENVWILDKLILFYSHMNEDYNIVCTYKDLPSFINHNGIGAKNVLDTFIKNHYIFKNKNHNYNINSNVYKVNKLVYERVKGVINANDLFSKIIKNTENITIEKLKKFNYTEIKNKCSKIKQKKIKSILVRDFDELVYAYLSRQSKTVLLLSGTIIEALLMYIVEKSGISNFIFEKKTKTGVKKENIKTIEMDMSQLLFVCTEKGLINSTPQKFIDGMKNFRNFIHPGRELKEKAIEVNENTVDLSWEMVCWLIKTIDFN